MVSIACTSFQAPEIKGIKAWINSEPLTIEEFRGKVVLVDFWTYSCVNCIRTFPYLREWNAKYADDGLVIIGVHSPEFEFEKDYSNVLRATQDNGITWPVAQDNDFETWQNYSNRFWPAKYLIDKEGVIRYTHFGEGAYDETEKQIRDLLIDAGADRPIGFLRRITQRPGGGPELHPTPQNVCYPRVVCGVRVGGVGGIRPAKGFLQEHRLSGGSSVSGGPQIRGDLF